MKRAKLAQLLKKDYVQTIIIVAIIIGSVVAFWYGLKFAFGTENPLLAVASESMEPVLYKGDLILVQGVHNACKINAATRDAETPGDIIVFHKPGDPKRELIVHRAVNKTIGPDGSCYFKTQGDRSYILYGYSPDNWERDVQEGDIVGKYTGTKVPLLGHIALFFEPLHVKVAFIMLWIIILVIIEVFPLWRKRVEKEQAQTKPLQKEIRSIASSSPL